MRRTLENGGKWARGRTELSTERKFKAEGLSVAAWQDFFFSELSYVSTVADGQKGNEFKWELVAKQLQE
jgi:hypothetical protein